MVTAVKRPAGETRGKWLQDLTPGNATAPAPDPTSGDLAGLKDVDGFGELPGAPGAAAELAQDPPGLELGVGAFAGGAEPGMGAVGVLLRGGLVPAPVGGAHRVTGAGVALVGQDD